MRNGREHDARAHDAGEQGERERLESGPLGRDSGADSRCARPAGGEGAAGQPFDPSKPDESDEETPTPDATRSVPIGRPMSDETFRRMKQDAERGQPPLRRRNVQQDR